MNFEFLKLQQHYGKWMPFIYVVISFSWRSMREFQRNRNFKDPIDIRTSLMFFFTWKFWWHFASFFFKKISIHRISNSDRKWGEGEIETNFVTISSFSECFIRCSSFAFSLGRGGILFIDWNRFLSIARKHGASQRNCENKYDTFGWKKIPQKNPH